MTSLETLLEQIRACRHCAASLPHEPRPVVQAGLSARLLIIGQAPGSKVHESGVPWDDPSGDRLREWTGLDKAAFYDPEQVALMPMGFCYPGKGKSGDLPPRKECAPLWHEALLAELPQVGLILLVGGYAQDRYLPPDKQRGMGEAVRGYSAFLPRYFPLPHPSWRSTIWMRANPWFESEVIPALRGEVRRALGA